ncbi:hypothetical protein JW968_02795 [Candidatus Woesearchaeota archaeon]|nr:hypothetical protein [Candidatus Woesearchaeota archaeon]
MERKRGEERAEGGTNSSANLILDQDLGLIRHALKNYITKRGISEKEMLRILAQMMTEKEKPMLPIQIFSSELGVLESIVKYMKENLCMKNSEIAKMLYRNDRTIWATYDKSQKKHPAPFPPADKKVIPIAIFQHREAGALEVLTIFMHDELELSFTQIGNSIGRDPRTIWTSYNKGKKKHNA